MFIMRISLRFTLFFSLFFYSYVATQAKDPTLFRGGQWSFVQNKNQWPAAVKYRAELPKGFLFLRDNALQYSFYDYEHDHAHGPGHEEEHEDHGKVRAHSFLVEFVGSQPKPNILPSQKISAYYNYLIGNDEEKWATQVPGYQQLRYQELYPEVDMLLQLQEEKKQFKYEFHLKAGADPTQIRMHYRQAEKIWLDEAGNLHIKTSVNEVMEQKPYSYQLINGKEVPVSSAFVLNGTEVSFELGKYNPSYPLVIDPVLVFSTFSGSFSDNWGSTAAADREGNLYSGGTVFGQTFPITSGAFELDFDGVTDIAILKYNQNGTGIFYGTFIGGIFHDIPYSMVVDNRNNLVIMGMTDSGDFPMTGFAYDRTYNGGVNNTPGIYSAPFRNGSDLFICKLNPTGSSLLGSTFLGGSSNDGLLTAGSTLVQNYGDEHRGEVIVDQDDNIYIASVTLSSNFPFTTPVTLENYAGVLAKLSSNLNRLFWAYPVGGINSDALYSVKIAPSGDVYACGGTLSPNVRTHNGALRRGPAGGLDGFVVRYSTNGDFLGGTYLGTRRTDQAYLLDLDEENNVYIFGQTDGPYPVTEGVYSNPNSGQFVHSLDPTLSQSRFSTVLGSGKGTPNISPTGFMINSCGNIFLAGWGGNIVEPGAGYFAGLNVGGMPLTPDAIKSTTDGSDFYLMVIESRAQSLLFGTYIGSEGTPRASDHVDGGTSRFDKETATIYQAVCACNGDDFPTTSGAFSSTNNSNNCNNAAFKLAFDDISANFTTTDLGGEFLNSGCAPLTVKFENLSDGDNNAYNWVIGDTLAISTEFEPVYTFEEPGIYEVTLTVTNALLCQEETLVRRVQVFGSEVTVSNDTTICRGESVILEVDGARSYTWSPAESLDNPRSDRPEATPEETTTYTVTALGNGGCQYEREVTVNVVPDVTPDFEFDITGGCGSPRTVTITNNTQGATNMSWDFGNGETYQGQNPPPIVYDQEGTYVITVNASAGECSGSLSREVEIVIENEGFFDNLEVSPDPTICFGESAQLVIVSAGDTYQWTPEETLSDPTLSNPVASPQETTRYQVRISVAGEPDCIIDTAITVNVIPEVRADFIIEQEGVCFETPQVQVTNTSEGGSQFSWLLGDGTTSNASQLPPFQYDEAGNYTITLIAENQGCTDTLSQEIVIDESQPDFLQTVRMPEDQRICAGESTQLAVSGEADTFRWSPAASLSDPTSSAPTATPEQTTTYTVRIGRRDAPGCETDSTVTVFVEEPFNPQFSAETPDQCGEPPAVRLTNLTEGQPEGFLWIIDGDTLRMSQPAEYLFDGAGVYDITLIATGGSGVCQNSTTQQIAVDDVNPANVITPNGDEKNDRFIIDTSRSGWQLAVFDRWGGEVFRSDDYQNDWGGDVKSGAYYYRLTSPEGFSCKGWIHVLVD